ncbi:CAI-1 autoinducer sensor kinase/phosphatase CqsS [compost metagenome]
MARILIAEDDPIHAEAAVVICKAARHTVTVVGNGLEALMLLDAVPFDLVLTDATMPRMGGATLVAAIRGSERPFAGIPIIGMASKVCDGAEALRDAGVDAFILKPVEQPALLGAIEQALVLGPAMVTITRRHTGDLANNSDAASA